MIKKLKRALLALLSEGSNSAQEAPSADEPAEEAATEIYNTTYRQRLQEYRKAVDSAPAGATFRGGYSKRVGPDSTSYVSFNSKAEALKVLDDAISGKIELVL